MAVAADRKDRTKPDLIDVDPRDLLAHPRNVRTNLGDLDELADSIGNSAAGMIHYPVLVPDGDSFLIIAGHRRTAAAVRRHDRDVAAFEATQAERDEIIANGGDWTGPEPTPPPDPVITCVVRPDLAGKTPEHLVAMLNENTHRERLTPADEAKGYEQLAAFEGYTPERIATVTGRSVAFVQGQLALAKLPSAAHALAAKGRLDLEDAAALEQLSGEPKVMQRILKRGDTVSGVRHIVADELRKRRCKAEAAQRIAELAKAGALIIGKPTGYPYSCRAVSVTKLLDADGQPLDPDKAALMPGFAAFVSANQGYPQVEIVCLNPQASGYQVRGLHFSRYESPEERAAREAEERAAERLRQALATAAEVRQKHIIEAFGTAKATKQLLKAALRAAAVDPHALSVDRRVAPLLHTLAGVEPDRLPDNASIERINRLLVARWLVHQEYAVLRAGDGWGGSTTAVAFLDWLVATTGYTLSDAESTLLDKLHDRLKPAPLPRETPDQLDQPCEECGADIDEACDQHCLLFDAHADEVPSDGHDQRSTAAGLPEPEQSGADEPAEDDSAPREGDDQ